MVNHNGNIIPPNALIFSKENRGYKYSDGLFETIRVFDGKIPFLKLHFERLMRGLQILMFDVPEYFNSDFLNKEINKLTQEKGNHRIRLTITRKDGGLYTPSSNGFDFLIEIKGLENNKFTFPDKGIRIGLIDDQLLNYNKFSSLKTTNCLPYIYAGLVKKKNGWDDALVLGEKEMIAEAVSSNIFMIKGNTLFTPPLNSGCVAGMTRQLIKEKIKVPLMEIGISKQSILESDGILLTNSIQGIKWVSQYQEKEFKMPEIGERLTRKLNELIENYRGNNFKSYPQ